MNNQSGSIQQRSIIEKRLELQSEITGCEPLISALKKFAENNAVYLPSAGNFGDGLIGLGTLCLFETIGINPKIHDFLADSVPPQAGHIIVGGGGGWLDGLWNHYAKILDGYLAQGGQVLILPSTVKGFESFLKNTPARSPSLPGSVCPTLILRRSAACRIGCFFVMIWHSPLIGRHSRFMESNIGAGD